MKLRNLVLILLLLLAATQPASVVARDVGTPAILIRGAESGQAHACAITPWMAVTAKHVVDNIQNPQWVKFPGATPFPVQTMWRAKDKHDLAKIRLDGEPNFTPVPVAADVPANGDPLTIEFIVDWQRGTVGIIHAWKLADLDSGNGFSIDGLIFPGLSGACVLNASGELVGVVSGLNWHDAPHVRSLGVVEGIKGLVK